MKRQRGLGFTQWGDRKWRTIFAIALVVGALVLLPIRAEINPIEPKLDNLELFLQRLELLARHPDTSEEERAAIMEMISGIRAESTQNKTLMDSALGTMREVRETGIFSGAVQKTIEESEVPLFMSSTQSKVAQTASSVFPARPKVPLSPAAPFIQSDVSRDLHPQNEVSIASNPKVAGNLIMSANDYRLAPFGGVRCGRYVSLDAGQTWAVSTAESNGFTATDPSVAFDAQGNAYLSCRFSGHFRPGVFLPDAFEGIEVSKSTDGGRTWSFPVVALEAIHTTVTQLPDGTRIDEIASDRPYIAAGPAPPQPGAGPAVARGTAVYISYTEVRAITERRTNPTRFSTELTFQIRLLKSSDGVTWSEPIDISPMAVFQRVPVSGSVDSARHQVTGSNLWVSSDGTLDIAWYDSLRAPPPAPFLPAVEGLWVGQFAVRVVRSVDGGATFGDVHTAAIKNEISGGAVRVVDIGGGARIITFRGFSLPPTRFGAWPTMFPVVRTHPTDSSRVYVAFGADPDPSPDTNFAANDDADIFFARSLDGGATWSAPVRVNDDAGINDQFFPWMTVQPNGNIVVIFGDRREDPGDTRYNIFIATSTDGGVSFRANKKVTAYPSHPNTQFFGSFIGDHFGLASGPTLVYAAWMDTRDQGSQDAWVGVGPPV